MNYDYNDTEIDSSVEDGRLVEEEQAFMENDEFEGYEQDEDEPCAWCALEPSSVPLEEIKQDVRRYVESWDRINPAWRHHMPVTETVISDAAEAMQQVGYDFALVGDRMLLGAVADWDKQAADMQRALSVGDYQYNDVFVLLGNPALRPSAPSSPKRPDAWPEDPEWRLVIDTMNGLITIRQSDTDSWQGALALVHATNDRIQETDAQLQPVA